VFDEVVEERRVQDRRGIKLLSGDRCADHCEDPGANDGADA
jgi:hypothetical protein